MSEIENMVEMPENVEETTEEITEEITEPVEEPTVEEPVVEEPAKVYTEEEFKDKLDKGIKRREAKIRKEYERKYGDLETVLKAGTGSEDVEQITGDLRQFYESKGVQIPTRPVYNDKDIAVLAKAEAEDIIQSGLDEVIEEVDRLASIGIEKMSAREKAVFSQLAAYRKDAEQARELSKIGVPEAVYNSQEYKEFASKFDSRTPASEIYNIYAKMQPKKEVSLPGSMKSNTHETPVKEFYSYEEAVKFTDADYDRTPGLEEAVVRSMEKWKR